LLLCLFASRRIGSNDGRDNSCGQGFAGWPRRVAGRLLAGLDYPAASLAGLRAARERWRAGGAARGSASTGLVLITLLTALSGVIDRLSADLLVVLLEGSQVLTGLGELTFLHTFTDIPVNEGTLGIHKIELVINAGEDLSDSSGVGDHAHGALNLGQIAAWDDGRGLVVDTALETSGAPVDELNGALGLDGGDGGVDILGDDITSVHHAAGHVLTVAGVALGHHGGGLEGRVGNLGNRELLVIGLLGRDHGGIRRQHEVNTRIRHQVSLELSDIDVEGTIESERGGQGGDDLGDQTVEVGVGRALNVQRSAADVIDGLVVEHDGDISVLEERVGRQDGVVRLDDGGGDLGRRIHGETELGLLTIVNRQALEEQGAETGSSTTTDGVEDHEALETSAVVGQLADAVEGEIDDLLTNGVVTTGIVVGSILLTRDELLGVEQLAVGTGADLIDHSGLEIDEHSAGDVLAGTSLREEGVEGIITATDGLVRGHLTIRLDAVLEAVKLPAGVTDLNTSLTDVDGDNFAHLG